MCGTNEIVVQRPENIRNKINLALVKETTEVVL
jgi:hypothetical protein